jgi:hypothetical protein
MSARSSVPLVDVRAARLAQATTAVLAIAAAAFRSPALLLLPVAHLAASALLGRRGNLPVLAFDALLRPRLAEARLEDARPPRFAAAVGAVLLAGALGALAAREAALGWSLALVVGGLAFLAATTGFCLGCWIYRLAAPLRGVRPGSPRHIDLADLGAPASVGLVVEFTHPLCADCVDLHARLVGSGRLVFPVDVAARPDLARKYGVAVVPLAFAVRPDGTVERRVRG